jgi:Ca2+-transporting ATPase
MVEKNAIVRKLPSVETLGCVTVICSDKTGTLTLNEMTVVSLVSMGAKATELLESDVTGTSYNPTGTVVGATVAKGSPLAEIAAACSVCNDAVIQWDAKDSKFARIGEPTEAALKVLGEKLGYPGRKSQSTDKGEVTHDASDHYSALFPKVATLEFSRGRKSMSVLCKNGPKSKKNVLFCKGAPENVLARCNRIRLEDGSTVNLTKTAAKKIEAQITDMSERPLRVLALAMLDELPSPLDSYDGTPDHKAHKQMTVNPDDFAAIEQDMVFLGLAGIKDPARPEVKPSIEKCYEAGIRVIMITGDNKKTAESIAREIGIFGPEEDVEGKSFEGREFMAMSHDDQVKALMEGGGGRVFSRTDPTDKQALVNLLKSQGEIPAMTGDGVNDAPALKAASIGIAMGIAGTEVAKEAADMVLADDNFATIVAAVEEGRAIYSNMKAFIRYLISSNIGEVASIFFTAALGFPEGLIPVQLLWVNLVTDGPPATALGFNPAVTPAHKHHT